MVGCSIVIKTAESTEAGGVDIAHVGLLTYILCYDDLLADISMTFPLLGPDFERIEIGRANNGPLRLDGARFLTPDGFISGRHAVIRCQGTVDVIDSVSTSKSTFVNGREIAGTHILQDGDMIEMGHSLFSYRRVPEPEARALAEPRSALVLGLTPTRSPETVTLVEKIRRLAPCDLSLALFGEPGTGKEHIAQQIHQMSGRADGPYVTFNCALIQGDMAESELFGHERGAFTGALNQNDGLVRAAQGGTLLLDEIGELPLSTQPMLLRAIEAREVRRVGSSKVHKIDVRWLAATNADISDEQRFRPDLLKRIAGYELHVPPLRKRREDLGTLAAYLLRTAGIKSASIKTAAARVLFLHQFPGNIRELRNTLVAAKHLAVDRPIGVHDLGLVASEADPGSAEDPIDSRQRDPGRAVLEAALKRAGNNKTRAAQGLRAHPRSFARWLKKHGLD